MILLDIYAQSNPHDDYGESFLLRRLYPDLGSLGTHTRATTGIIHGPIWLAVSLIEERRASAYYVLYAQHAARWIRKGMYLLITYGKSVFFIYMLQTRLTLLKDRVKGKQVDTLVTVE